MSKQFNFVKYLQENKIGPYAKSNVIKEGFTDQYDFESAYNLKDAIAAIQDEATRKRIMAAVEAFAKEMKQGTNEAVEGSNTGEGSSSKMSIEEEEKYVKNLIEVIKSKYPDLSKYMHLYKRIDPSTGTMLNYGIGYQGFPAKRAEMDTEVEKMDIVDLPTLDKVSIGNSGYVDKAGYREQVTDDSGAKVSPPQNTMLSIGDGKSNIAQALFVISKPKNM